MNQLTVTEPESIDRFGIPISALAAEAVARITPTATLNEVADALAASSVGALIVGRGSDVDGIISERDLVWALADRKDPGTTRAGDIAHSDLIWCDANSTVAEVAYEMMSRYVRHVLVEDEGRLIGIVSARDLLGAYANGDLISDGLR